MIEPTGKATVQIYFSDFFDVSPALLEDHGAFDVSLINDLPLFIDPFLLFNSRNPDYQHLHEELIRYLRFLETAQPLEVPTLACLELGISSAK